MTKCQKDLACGIILKRGLFKDIKNYIPTCQTHECIFSESLQHPDCCSSGNWKSFENSDGLEWEYARAAILSKKINILTIYFLADPRQFWNLSFLKCDFIQRGMALDVKCWLWAMSSFLCCRRHLPQFVNKVLLTAGWSPKGQGLLRKEGPPT